MTNVTLTDTEWTRVRSFLKDDPNAYIGQNLPPGRARYGAQSQDVSQVYEAGCTDVIRSLCLAPIVMAGAYPAIYFLRDALCLHDVV
jgi:hypothetical protein